MAPDAVLTLIVDGSSHIEGAIAETVRPASSVWADAPRMSDLATGAARMMLGEVLDWRIIHATHEVELT